MLRIIWILPGGCALLAVLVLALAFKTVDRSHAQLMPNAARTRVALIELGEHPEWRQFLTLSAVQRANELNRLRELPDIQGANDVATGTPKVAPQPANRSDSDPEDSNVLNMQSRAADIGASTPVQAPIATRDENQAVGIQEEKAAVGTLLEDTPVAVQEEKPTVSAFATGTPKVAPQPANRSDSDPEDSNVLNMQSRAADIGASTPVQAPIATRDENQAVDIQEEKAAIGTLLEDTPVAVQEEKPTVSALEEIPLAIQKQTPTVSAFEENPVAIGEEKPTKSTPGKKSATTRTPQRVKPRTQSKGVQHVRSRARAPSKQNPPSPQYFFDSFGHQQASQTSTPNYFADQQARQVSTPNANNDFGNQRAGRPEMPNASNY